MRWFFVLCAAVCLGCDDEDLLYADGSVWKPVDMGTIRISPGAAVPRDMNAREWDNYISNARAQYYRDGQTEYDTGTGFWIGLDTDGIPKLSIGNSAGNKLTWDGSSLAISGSLDLTNTVQTFTPDWLDFSSDPAGTFNYIDLGRVVLMWTDADRHGTSNDIFMRWNAGSIPAAIRPSSTRVIDCTVLDNVTTLKGGVVIAANGGATFTIDTVSGSQLVDSGNTFTSPAVPKGLNAGWLVIYPK